MLIRHSSEILVNRLAQIEARSMEASQALVAKIRGQMMISAAIEKLDAPADQEPKAKPLVDISA